MFICFTCDTHTNQTISCFQPCPHHPGTAYFCSYPCLEAEHEEPDTDLPCAHCHWVTAQPPPYTCSPSCKRHPKDTPFCTLQCFELAHLGKDEQEPDTDHCHRCGEEIKHYSMMVCSATCNEHPKLTVFCGPYCSELSHKPYPNDGPPITEATPIGLAATSKRPSTLSIPNDFMQAILTFYRI